ncbi:MAG: hypothetical protein K8R48_01730 [Alphaproteobacteria bacterium]|nr:hypothetical protein [Alphaproteobacteria bacterium]
MNTFKKLLIAGLLATATAAGQAVAATDGTLGLSSTGTIDITLTIPELFRISHTSDFLLGTYGGSGDMEANNDVCVWSNGNGAYQVTITDDSGMSPDGFAVEDIGGTAQINMGVFWHDAPGTTGGTAVTYGVPLAAANANTTSSDCTENGFSANLHILLPESDLRAAAAGSYSTRLTVLVQSN